MHLQIYTFGARTVFEAYPDYVVQESIAQTCPPASDCI